MQHELAHLADEQYPLLGAIIFRRVAAARTGLARLVRVHLHGPAARQQRLVGEVAVHPRKRPLGSVPIGLALLDASTRAMFAAPTLAQVPQLLPADETVRVGIYDAPTDQVVAIVLQPSLSPRDHDEASC